METFVNGVKGYVVPDIMILQIVLIHIDISAQILQIVLVHIGISVRIKIKGDTGVKCAVVAY